MKNETHTFGIEREKEYLEIILEETSALPLTEEQLHRVKGMLGLLIDNKERELQGTPRWTIYKSAKGNKKVVG